jgi:hypothetical protein
MRFTASRTDPAAAFDCLGTVTGDVGKSADARRQSVLPQELQRRLGISSEKRYRQPTGKIPEVADGVTGFS